MGEKKELANLVWQEMGRSFKTKCRNFLMNYSWVLKPLYTVYRSINIINIGTFIKSKLRYESIMRIGYRFHYTLINYFCIFRRRQMDRNQSKCANWPQINTARPATGKCR